MLPPPPFVEPEDQIRRSARGLAAALIVSTPISGIATFALIAILFGEPRLEGPDGLTVQGGLAYGLPAIIGAMVLLWSFSSVPFPSRQVLAAICAGISAFCLLVGFLSLRGSTESNDPSIGGPILIVFSLLLGVAALVLGGRSTGNDQR